MKLELLAAGILLTLILAITQSLGIMNISWWLITLPTWGLIAIPTAYWGIKIALSLLVLFLFTLLEK